MLAVKIDLRTDGKAIISIMVRGYSTETVEYTGTKFEAYVQNINRVTVLKVDDEYVAEFPAGLTYILRKQKS